MATSLHWEHEFFPTPPVWTNPVGSADDRVHEPGEQPEPSAALTECARLESRRWRVAGRHENVSSADSWQRVIKNLLNRASTGAAPLWFLDPPDREWLLDNFRLVRAALREVASSRRSQQEQPRVQGENGLTELRPWAIARAFLHATDFCFDAESLALYLSGWHENHTLEMGELWALKPALQAGILHELAAVVAPVIEPSTSRLHLSGTGAGAPIPRLVTSLQQIGEADWKLLFEQISQVDHILRQDPAGAYATMDSDSRDLYRSVVADLASHSGFDEVEVAETAVALARTAARQTAGDARIRQRESHVGFYLVDGGLPVLKRRIGHRAPLGQRLRDLLRRYPNAFYLIGIEISVFLIVTGVLAGLPRFAPIVASFLFLFIPASQTAVEVMNAIVTALLPARRLPKLDFSDGIPDQYKTMVAVPALLLNQQQVDHLVRSLEVRYLANRDPNLYFALLTDGPDSNQPVDEKEVLAEYCSDLIRRLNREYAAEDHGPFFLFHRHRVFNASENVWMGWERKRGKLLDLNKLLRESGDDRFPIQVGDLSVLPRIRFVITLDSDTQLPRDAARRLVGTLAHPLNRAIVDPVTRTVRAGYAILQPRVGISVHSAYRSRLASIYSGQTGFDIYTRAVSDVYQDLYGEGIFTGKGIYEVDTFREVLDERFPCNTLLSHDLIEGAYARAALVSDIELIDDYPSHFSAYSRRKHRWVRGDWQIMQWLFPRVPDYHGRMVANPTAVVSRWKIFDNLRRSLIEPCLFFLLLAGWFFLPGPPWYWTLATIALLLLPVYAQVLVSLLRVRKLSQLRNAARCAVITVAKGHLNVLLALTFVPQQALVMIDAIIRTIVRHRITGRRLLEWETAAEAESSQAKRAPADVYLAATPWIALGISLALALRRPEACLYAAPFLLLWAGARSVARWLSLRRPEGRHRVRPRDERFLRSAALRTWRYFRENSGPRENWLVPDNVQETPAMAAHRVSPTNLGLLLNARQAAYGLGYLTLPEFVNETAATLVTARSLPKYRGHFFNWYSTWTLDPLEPLFISTVDSGNLAASLWALKQGCLALLEEPLLPESLWQGILDHVRILRALDGEKAKELHRMAADCGTDCGKWLERIDALQHAAQGLLSGSDHETCWWAAELVDRVTAVRELVCNFLPWLGSPVPGCVENPISLPSLTLERLPAVIAQVRAGLGPQALGQLSDALTNAAANAEALQAELRRLAAEAGSLVNEMDFGFLYNPRKKLLAIGYDVCTRQLHPSCYDLLASEARTAAFVAIAKGDIPQVSWFHLSRALTAYRGRRVLQSWTGTMFEYLMPNLWMRTYSRTILEQSSRAAVEIQRLYLRGKRVPWGISESAHAATDANGCYQYHAFGLPALALKRAKEPPHVLAPYASFLALESFPASAVGNLRKMSKRGWAGGYGFYDAIDFEDTQTIWREPRVVRSWMAHHQAMSLMAVANRLLDRPFQQYFHTEPQVMATELLLQERIPGGMKVETEPVIGPSGLVTPLKQVAA